MVKAVLKTMMCAQSYEQTKVGLKKSQPHLPEMMMMVLKQGGMSPGTAVPEFPSHSAGWLRWSKAITPCRSARVMSKSSR